MPRRLMSLFAATFVAGCAGAAAGPVLEFRPSGSPLAYDVAVSGSQLVETPMGTQRSNDSAHATVLLEIGDPSGGGWAVSAVYQALSLQTSGGLGSTQKEGGELIGMRFAGILSRDGIIEIAEAPDTPPELSDAIDPSALLAELLVPLPPEAHAGAEPWPVSTTTTSRTMLTITSTFKGSARFTGDTIWNGRQARVIVADGAVEISGRGTPAGVPAEIEMVLAGESTRLYVWDVERGVMLASTHTTEATGQVTVVGMDMSMPIEVTARQVVELKEQ